MKKYRCHKCNCTYVIGDRQEEKLRLSFKARGKEPIYSKCCPLCHVKSELDRIIPTAA